MQRLSLVKTVVFTEARDNKSISIYKFSQSLCIRKLTCRRTIGNTAVFVLLPTEYIVLSYSLETKARVTTGLNLKPENTNM